MDAPEGRPTEPTAPWAALDDIRTRLSGVDNPLALLVGLFAFSPVPYQVYRADGVSLLTNPAFRELFGSEPPPEYNVLRDEIAEREGILALIRCAFAGKVVHTPAVWYDPRQLSQIRVEHGRRVAIEATFFPLFDGDGAVSHVAVAFRDVTAQVTAREVAEADRDWAQALAAEREAVLAQLADGVILTDPQGNIVFVNEAARRLHGVSELGISVTGYSAAYHLFTLEGEPYPSEQLPLARAVLQGETVIDARWRIRRPDGTEIVAGGSATPIRAADGSRLGNALVVHDLTAQAELELEKEMFLADAAHDLKTPITAVLASAQLVLRRLEQGRHDPARVKETMTTMESAARRMQALVDEMLDMTRLRLDRPLELNRRPTDLVPLTREAIARHQLATDHHRLRLEAAEPELVGWWDATRLDRVLENLLDNAVKYSPGGGDVVVRLGREDSPGGAWAVIAVSDTGIGIPASDVPLIYQRFWRGGNVAGRIRGTGIGLASTRQVVEDHGGTIDLESTEGLGTTFTVRLPL